MMQNENCPCKKKKCERHGKCDECKKIIPRPNAKGLFIVKGRKKDYPSCLVNKIPIYRADNKQIEKTHFCLMRSRDQHKHADDYGDRD